MKAVIGIGYFCLNGGMHLRCACLPESSSAGRSMNQTPVIETFKRFCNCVKAIFQHLSFIINNGISEIGFRVQLLQEGLTKAPCRSTQYLLLRRGLVSSGE
jgi:hypothetical protein